MTKTRKRPKSGISVAYGFGLLVCLVCLLAGTVSGQRTGSAVARTIEGSVLDRDGQPVPGAVVLIEDLKTLQVRSYIVQPDGKFHFRGLSSDANYQLRARFNGMMSKPKTVSVFESKPTVTILLKLAVKQKRPPTNRSPSVKPS